MAWVPISSLREGGRDGQQVFRTLSVAPVFQDYSVGHGRLRLLPRLDCQALPLAFFGQMAGLLENTLPFVHHPLMLVKVFCISNLGKVEKKTVISMTFQECLPCPEIARFAHGRQDKVSNGRPAPLLARLQFRCYFVSNASLASSRFQGGRL